MKTIEKDFFPEEANQNDGREDCLLGAGQYKKRMDLPASVKGIGITLATTLIVATRVHLL